MKILFAPCFLAGPLLLVAATLSPSALAAKPYCGIVDGKFRTECPEAPLPTGTAQEELRAQECRQLSQEMAGQSGMGSFSATVKKDDLQKIYARRCTPQSAQAAQKDGAPECQRLASDLRGLVGAQTQSSLQRKTDLLRQYDNVCGDASHRRRTGVVIVR